MDQRPPSRRIALASFAAVLVVHLVANPQYGFFRDELYFIMCGTRPAFGYVDQPPITPLLAAGSQLFGRSLFLLRAVAALFAAGSVYMTCLLAIELGGGSFAQVLGAIVAFLCPVLMSFGTKQSPDTPGLVLWPLVVWCVLRALRGGGDRYWLIAGAALGLAFEAKYSAAFFGVALFAGIIASSHRRQLLSKGCLGGVAIALAVCAPNVLWQLSFGLPMLELLRAGQEGKNVILGPLEYLLAQVLITGLVLAVVWIAGLVWSLRNPATRLIGIMFVVLMIEMILLHGKHYYPADVYPILIAAGAVAIEAWTSSRRWLRPVLSIGCVASALPLVPYVLPILPVESMIAYHHWIAPKLHLEAAKTEHQRVGVLPPDWADMHGWPELEALVVEVYRRLPEADRRQALIAASNYGEAAAIEFFGAGQDLPPVISGHNQYYLWGTHDRSGEVLIDVNGDCGAGLGLYRSSTVAATFSHPHVMPYEDQRPILVCRGLTRPLEEVWPMVKRYR
jgi:hypothetical protein